jgi:hypothetical protein
MREDIRKWTTMVTLAGLPGIFDIWILEDGGNDGFAADAPSGKFTIPPQEFPTIRSMFPTAEP